MTHPPSIGHDAIERTINNLLARSHDAPATSDFNTTIDIQEITPTAPDWAFARTESTRRNNTTTTRTLASASGRGRGKGGGRGEGRNTSTTTTTTTSQTPSSNNDTNTIQELFILQKIKLAEQRSDGQGQLWGWRIARWCSHSHTA